MSAELELKEAKRIFDDAVEMPPAQRTVFLERVCASNPILRQRVEFMIREFESGSAAIEPPFINRPAKSSQNTAPFAGTARFAVQRQLGSGAFGTVYQAWDREQQVRVALKVLHSHKPDLLFRFKHEFRTLVYVRHPNIIRLYELFSEGEQWFFSMELVEGADFLEYVRPGGGPCDLQRLRAALGQLAQAVQALHAARLLHRDLKPANALGLRPPEKVL
jgi:serine/threonine protein kinase